MILWCPAKQGQEKKWSGASNAIKCLITLQNIANCDCRRYLSVDSPIQRFWLFVISIQDDDDDDNDSDGNNGDGDMMVIVIGPMLLQTTL